ncbi:uroporphyrinogen-III C-methyltransferase [Mesorhizobium sp. RP14(2022)]|uniref:uroporphyrinogen-III C-methyltransferase n=1 Tax=Mesorhizobium liriopis TaxID=2953882 RepID=A0ABT1C716_9HYPH|nr:uroporphyrinogen-III C-methyltransferase [Mesorhizobium liriopis]MCO6049791.1 uroporphyrinogen-III C-methyltransferase [Mesorhizobium liriopis]
MSLADALARLAPTFPPFEPGHVWLAGAGPGRSGSLTLDVVAALSEADHVVYDALVDPAVLRAAGRAELHHMGKRGGQTSAAQSDITATLIRLARTGGRVLRLKGGDPFIFGRGGEEVLALAEAGIPFRVLPGVTAALGAMASALIPTTMRGFNKAVILATGHAADEADDLDWAALARTGQPVIIYMGLKNLGAIVHHLREGGLNGDTPAGIIMSGGTDAERVLTATLDTLAMHAKAEGFASPALIIVGSIVSLRDQLLGTPR